MPLRFTKSTDSEHEVKLDSYLIAARWRVAQANIGHRVPFEARTAMVGEGAGISVRGASLKGLNLGRVTGQVRSNRFQGEFEIPNDAEVGDRVYFEVELSSNDLEDRSEEIPVVPAVQVFNLKWGAEVARRGDIVNMTADVNGLQDGTEVAVVIYEHDRDGAHDRIVELPGTVEENKLEIRWEYQYHEDTDEILTQAELEEYGGSYNPPEYFFTVKVEAEEYGANQESGLLTFKDHIEFELLDDEGNGKADERYVAHLADGSRQEGRTNERGRGRLEDIPPGPYRIAFPDVQGFGRTQRGQD